MQMYLFLLNFVLTKITYFHLFKNLHLIYFSSINKTKRGLFLYVSLSVQHFLLSSCFFSCWTSVAVYSEGSSLQHRIHHYLDVVRCFWVCIGIEGINSTEIGEKGFPILFGNMITRSKLVEQLRDYQIRSQHKCPPLTFFSPKLHLSNWYVSILSV